MAETTLVTTKNSWSNINEQNSFDWRGAVQQTCSLVPGKLAYSQSAYQSSPYNSQAD
jgi:hypothetical protein